MKHIFLLPFFIIALAVQAVTIDFNNLGVVSNITINGFAGTFNGFDVSTPHGHFQSHISAASRADNGTTYLLNDDANGMTIVANDGSAFSLSQFDAAEWDSSFSGNQQVVVTGTFLGGGTTIQNFTSDATSTDGNGGLVDFETYTVNSSFNNLISLNIRNANADMAWDNIVLNEASAVPEPSSVVLLLGAFALFSFRKSNT